MATRMQQRRGTAAQWTAANPVLAAGEIGFETDTSKFKMGNGSSAWTALAYFSNTTALEALLNDGAPAALNTLNELAAAIGDDPAFFSNIAGSIADNIDSHNVTTNIHGIANTALLATLTNVANAKTEVTTALENAVTGHSSDTTDVHGITNTALLATQNYADAAVTTHSTDTTDVHGITNTADLATKTYADTAVSTHSNDTTDVHGITNTVDLATKAYADGAVSTHQADTTEVHGISNTANLAYVADITDHNNDTTEIHGISNTGNLAYLSDLTAHSNGTTEVHGIANTALLATQNYVDTALGNATVNQSLLAGVGLDYNSATDAFDIDSTIATKVYADGAVSTHQDDTTNVHGIANTALLATTADVAAVTKSSLGLGSVDNTADASKPVSTAQAAAIAAAQAAAISDATSQVNALITGAPSAMNTLDELAAALGDDANFAASVTVSLGLKVDSVTPISQKTASYTLSLLSERDDLIEMGSSSAMTLTIPTNATVAWPVGTSIDILQTGTGQVTVAGAGGVTVNATPGLKLRTQYSSATLFKRAENTWVVFGDLTA